VIVKTKITSLQKFIDCIDDDTNCFVVEQEDDCFRIQSQNDADVAVNFEIGNSINETIKH
jgi:hypothetical protein